MALFIECLSGVQMSKTLTVIINHSSGADPERAEKLREEIDKAFP